MDGPLSCLIPCGDDGTCRGPYRERTKFECLEARRTMTMTVEEIGVELAAAGAGGSQFAVATARSPLSLHVKRSIDVLGALVALIILLPLMIAVALAVRLS